MTTTTHEFDLAGKHIVLCIPTYDGNVPTDQMVAIINTMTLCRMHGVTVTLEIRSGSSLIEKARAELLHQFLYDTDGTHCIFVDADIVWEPNDILRLLAFCTVYDAVCGPYQTKEKNPDFHYGMIPGPDGKVIQNEHGLIKIKSAPMGFNCFTRDVLERLVAAHPELNFVPMRGDFKDQEMCGIFHMMIHKDEKGIPRMVGEDIAFYMRLMDLGAEAWVDQSIQLRHIGKAEYSQPYMDWVRAKNAESGKLDSAA